MSQSNVIVGAIILAFIAWVTLRGSLGNYLADLGIGQKPGGTGSPAAAGSPSGLLGSAVSGATSAIPFSFAGALSGVGSAAATPAASDAGSALVAQNFAGTIEA